MTPGEGAALLFEGTQKTVAVLKNTNPGLVLNSTVDLLPTREAGVGVANHYARPTFLASWIDKMVLQAPGGRMPTTSSG